MIGKDKNPIIRRGGDLLNISYGEVKQYVADMKAGVQAGWYRIARNRKRQANADLYRDYVIDEEKTRNILLDLTTEDFCEVLQNEHAGFEHECLYVFGKEVRLLQRFGMEAETVPLYIKFNKLADRFVIVISFHKQEYPLTYAFR